MINIYKASAGSGKTYKLTEQYITFMLGERQQDGSYQLRRGGKNRHRDILAITFTNKATEEMKRRIVHELAVLAGKEPGWSSASPYERTLCENLHCEPEELRVEAEKALTSLLFDFNYFHVSTIDAFFQTVLRTFAREVDLAGNFELELEEDYAINLSVRELLRHISELDAKESRRSPLMMWILRYMESIAREGKQFNLFNHTSTLFTNMVSLIKDMRDEKFAINAELILPYLKDNARLERFVDALSRREQTLRDDVKRTCTDMLDRLASREDVVNYHFLNALRKWQPNGWDSGASKLGATILNVYESPTAAFKKTAFSKLTESERDALSSLAYEAAKAIVNCHSEILYYRIVKDNIYILGLLGDILERLQAYCKENNLFLLSDTNELLRQIIGTGEVPYIYERIGVWLNHFLFDEFQDTSYMQWQNLRPLLDESLSKGNDNLIIGDEKQCIYRFRNSDPSLIHTGVQEQYPHDTHVTGDTAEGNTNWRSSADVVRFNNELFATLGEQMGFADTYCNATQEVAKKNLDRRGYVRCIAVEKDKDDKGSYADQVLENLACDIARQIRSGYHPNEIAVLTRSRKNAERTINFLIEKMATDEEYPKFNVISDDSLTISLSPAVRYIVSMLRYISANDFSTKHGVSARYIAKLFSRYEYVRSSQPELSASQAITKAVELTLGDAPEHVYTPDAIGGATLTSVVEDVIRHLPEGVSMESENVFISAFQDLVADFCERGEGDIQSFLQWWDMKGKNSVVSSPEDESAIRVLTIHKSKGLEFRCVHLPFVNWKVVDDRDVEWFFPAGFDWAEPEDVPPLLPLKRSSTMVNTPLRQQYETLVKQQMLDELNIAYVAFTRAIDELIVHYDNSSGSMGAYLDAALTAMGEGSHTMGSPTIPTPESGKQPTALDPTGTIEMPTYVTDSRSDIWAQMSIEHPLGLSLEEARERGILLHRVMQNVHHLDDILMATRRIAMRGLIPADKVESIAAHLLSQAENHTEWFEGYSHIALERPVILADGSVKRPDRMVWLQDGTVDIIDYKFGQERPAKYRAQVRGYMEALRAAGYEKVRGYIWYVDSGVIVKV